MARRGNGEGSIISRKDGRTKPHEVRLWADGKQRTVGYCRTKREANALLRDKRREVDEGRFLAKQGQTLGEWMMTWLDSVKKPVLAELSYRAYCVAVDPVVDRFTDVPLQELTVQQIRSCLLDLRETHAARSVQLTHAVLKGALKDAVREGILARNPMELLDRPRVEEYVPTIFSVEEIRRIIEETQDDPWHALWVLLLTTGMRRGEATGLLWEYVGPDYLVVEHAVKYVSAAPYLGTPKSARSRRWIGLPPVTVERLARHRETHGTHPLVFCTESGAIVPAMTLANAWKRMLARLGLEHRRLHDTRHSFASMLSSSGLQLQMVQHVLGHSNISMTTRYSHLAPSSPDVMQRVSELLEGK